MDSLIKLYIRPKKVSDNQAKEDFNWAVNVNRKALKILGLWSYPNSTRQQIIVSTFHVFFLSVFLLINMTLPQTIALFKVWGNLALTVDNLLINLPSITTQFKILILWFKKHALANIFQDMEKDWLKTRHPQERYVMIKYAAVGKLITVCTLLFGNFCIVLYMSPIIFGMVPREVNNLTDKYMRVLPLQTVYFYDISKNNRYYSTLLSQVICSVVAASIYISMAALFGITVLHACGQLKILAMRIKITVNEKNWQSAWKNIIQQHYQLIRYNLTSKIICVILSLLIRFTGQIEAVFSLMLLALFQSIIITLCVLEFRIITVLSGNAAEISVMHIIFDLQFMLTFIFVMFTYSWVAEYLVTQSDAIYTAACNCKWTSCDPRNTSQLTLFLIRAQYPLLITAGKLAAVRLPTFVTLLKTSLGYASVLRAVKE